MNKKYWIKKLKRINWRRLVRQLPPHAAIILSGMLIVFFIIDRVNKPMGFMTNEFHKRITFALALLSIWSSIRLIAAQRRAERAEYRRRLREMQQKRNAGRPAAPASHRPGPAAAKDPKRRPS